MNVTDTSKNLDMNCFLSGLINKSFKLFKGTVEFFISLSQYDKINGLMNTEVAIGHGIKHLILSSCYSKSKVLGFIGVKLDMQVCRQFQVIPLKSEEDLLLNPK